MAMVNETPLRVLVLCDDYYHPARTPRAGLAPLESSFAFDWIEEAAEWSAERMATYPVVILTKSNNVSAADQTPWMTPDIEAAFRTYVQNGGGLLAIHSGTAGYEDCAVLRGVLGGVFAEHPDQCEVTIAPVEGQPLAAGSAPFTIFDEHYMMAFDDQDATVFLTSSSTHGTQPAGWTRREGEGRVSVLTPGHNLDVWLNPVYGALIVRALRWCGDFPTE